MTTLADILLAPGRRARVVTQTAAWLERHVASRGGLRGLTLKAGLKALKAARPDAVERSVERLLPEFARALEPLFQRFRASGGKDFSAYLERHADEATAALMAVADARARATSHRALAGGYAKMRGTLESELHGLLPGIAKMMGGLL